MSRLSHECIKPKPNRAYRSLALILGALLVMTMTIGYIATDRWAMSPAKPAPDLRGRAV